MSFPRYKQYKDSGVEWLGEVPEHWKLGKLHHIAILNPAKAELGDIDPQTTISFLPMEAFDTKGDPSLSLERTIGQVETGYTYFRDGDVAFAKVTPCFENGKRAIFSKLTNGVGFGTTELIILRARHRQTIPKFLYWLVATSEFLGLGEGSMYGAGGLKRVPESFVHQFPVCVPSTDEQNSIVAFLDQETAKIDALIEEQRRLVELLKEKRQAVISHVVTKGLDVDTPMKNSGIEWLEEVPAHWTMNRIRHLFRQEKRQLYPEKPVLSVYRDYGVILRDSRDDNMNKTPEDLSAYQLVNPDDLVVNKMKAWQGSLGVSTFDGITSPDYVVFTPRHREFSAFIHLLFRSQSMVSIYRSISNGIRPAQWRLEPDVFLGLPIFLPPIAEQRKLVSFIEDQTLRFDELRAEAEKAIEVLQERRTTLISAVVIGKIDVRSYNPKEAA